MALIDDLRQKLDRQRNDIGRMTKNAEEDRRKIKALTLDLNMWRARAESLEEELSTLKESAR